MTDKPSPRESATPPSGKRPETPVDEPIQEIATDGPTTEETTAKEVLTKGASAENSSAPDALVWTVHPLVDRPRAALLLLLLLAGILLLIRLNFAEPEWTLFAAAILLISLARFFFPTTYRLDDEAIHARFLGITRDYRWSVYRRVERGKNGVFLSPFVRPDRLDNFRGLLLLAGRNRTAVEAFARGKIGDRAGSHETGQTQPK